MPEVKLKFTSDHSQVDNSVSKIKGSLAGLKSSAGNVLGEFGMGGALGIGAVATAVTGLVTALATGVKSTMSMAGALQDMSDATGINITNLSILQRMFELAGSSGDKVEGVFLKMNNVLDDNSLKTQEWLRELNLDKALLQTRDQYEQFILIGDALSQLEDKGHALAGFTNFFGKGNAARMATLFASGPAIQEAAMRDLGRMPEVLDENAQKITEIEDGITAIGLKWDQFMLGFTNTIGPTIKAVADFFKDVDLTKWGAAVGLVFKDILPQFTILKAFKNGLMDVAQLWIRIVKEIFVLVKYGIDKAYEYAVAGAKKLGLGKLLGLTDVNPTETGSYGEYRDKFFGTDEFTLFENIRDQLQSYNDAYQKTAGAEKETKPVGITEEEQAAINKRETDRLIDIELDKVNKNELARIKRRKDNEEYFGKLREQREKEENEKEEKAAKQRQSDLEYVNSYFKELREYVHGEKGHNQSVDAALAQAKSVEKHPLKAAVEPVLGRLASIGGAKHEVPYSVITYQKESLKYQREMANGITKMAKHSNIGTSVFN